MKLLIKRKAWSQGQNIARFSILLTRADGSSSILTGWQDRNKEKYMTRTALNLNKGA